MPPNECAQVQCWVCEAPVGWVVDKDGAHHRPAYLLRNPDSGRVQAVVCRACIDAAGATRKPS